MNKEAKLIAKYKDNPRDLEAVHKKINEILPYYAKYLLPRILLTGTPIDEQDTVFKSDSGEDILDINEILGYELLPVLIQQLCLNSNPVFEKKILHLMMRMYNQRQEFSDSVQHLLLLFEERNIRNYNRSKNLVQRLQKYTEESEVRFLVSRLLTAIELAELSLYKRGNTTGDSRHTLVLLQ